MKFPILLFLFIFWFTSLVGQQSITGQIVSPSAVPICEVLVELLDDQEQVIAQDLTEEDGSFQFTEVASSAEYTLRMSKEDDYLNGTSTFDLVLIWRAVLGQTPFTHPAYYWAADVNGSGTVTTLDMIIIRKLILQISEDFVPPPWLFDTEDLPLDTAPDNLVEVTVGEEDIDVSIIGVKVGDINDTTVQTQSCL